jgi:hypothetical protein
MSFSDNNSQDNGGFVHTPLKCTKRRLLQQHMVGKGVRCKAALAICSPDKPGSFRTRAYKAFAGLNCLF